MLGRINGPIYERDGYAVSNALMRPRRLATQSHCKLSVQCRNHELIQRKSQPLRISQHSICILERI